MKDDWWELDVTHRGLRVTARVIGRRNRLEQASRDAIDRYLSLPEPRPEPEAALWHIVSSFSRYDLFDDLMVTEGEGA